MRILHELSKVASGLQPKTEPVPLVISGVGQVGHLSQRHGVYINSAYRQHVRTILREHYRADRLARELTRGSFGADDLLPVAAKISDSRDAIRAIKRMSAAISSWDGVTNARGNGKSWDYLGTKASQTTVANQWSSFLRTGGNPSAMSAPGAIPGGERKDSSTTGAWPLPMSLGGSEDLYLSNIGANHATGTNIVLCVDVLVGAGSISATSTTSQNITSTSLARWTTGEGLNMTLEITTALGATAANITLSYTDQAGNTGNSTGAIALTTSGIAGRLQPVQDGPMIRFASGDYGVRVVEGCILSASMAAGVLALWIYKPLVIFPTVATTTFVERSTPAQVGGIRKLTASAGGTKPCIGFFVLTSTTSTGVQSYLLETVWG
jgi:hypothetical protein